jgi:uncharacterized membrane protein
MATLSVAMGEKSISLPLHFQILRAAITKKFAQLALLRALIFTFVMFYFAAHFYYYFLYKDFSSLVHSCLDGFAVNFAYLMDLLYIIKSEYTYYAVVVIAIFPIIIGLIGYTVISDYRRYRNQLNFIETKARKVA